MVASIIDFLMKAVVQIIGATGYAGVFLLMLLESCGIPAPSEVIMPFSGFLVATGQLNFWIVALMGTLGNVSGSVLAYYIGLRGGRPLIEKYGRLVLIPKDDLDKADKWFVKYGQAAVFIGRLLPVIRTYISFPAGIARMNIGKFLIYTFLGALPWSILFTYFGIKLQNNWPLIRDVLHNFDIAILAVIALLIIFYIWKRKKRHLG